MMRGVLGVVSVCLFDGLMVLVASMVQGHCVEPMRLVCRSVIGVVLRHTGAPVQRGPRSRSGALTEAAASEATPNPAEHPL